MIESDYLLTEEDEELVAKLVSYFFQNSENYDVHAVVSKELSLISDESRKSAIKDSLLSCIYSDLRLRQDFINSSSNTTSNSGLAPGDLGRDQVSNMESDNSELTNQVRLHKLAKSNMANFLIGEWINANSTLFSKLLALSTAKRAALNSSLKSFTDQYFSSGASQDQTRLSLPPGAQKEINSSGLESNFSKYITISGKAALASMVVTALKVIEKIGDSATPREIGIATYLFKKALDQAVKS